MRRNPFCPNCLIITINFCCLVLIFVFDRKELLSLDQLSDYKHNFRGIRVPPNISIPTNYCILSRVWVITFQSLRVCWILNKFSPIYISLDISNDPTNFSFAAFKKIPKLKSQLQLKKTQEAATKFDLDKHNYESKRIVLSF